MKKEKKKKKKYYLCRHLDFPLDGVADSRHGDHHQPEMGPEVDAIIRRDYRATPPRSE